MRIIRWFFAASCVVAGVAHAQQPGRIAVVAVDGCDTGLTAPHATHLRNALIARESSRVLSGEATYARLGGVPQRSLEEAERLLTSARYDVLDPSAVDRAERTLRSVVENLRLLTPSEATWENLRDAQTMLAYLEYRKSNKGDAEEAMARVLAVEPRYEPSTDFYPPSFRAWVATVRKGVVKRSTSKLVIESFPKGRPAYLESRLVGSTPVTVRVPSGRYRVEVDFDTGGSLPREVQVGETTKVSFSREFEGQIFAEQGPCLGTDRARVTRLDSMVRLGNIFEVDELVGVRIEEPSKGERFLVATSVDVRNGQETREGKLKLDGGTATPASYMRLAEFLFTGEAEPPVQVSLGGTMKEPQIVEQPRPPVVSAPAEAVVATPAPVQRATPVGAYVAGGVGVAGIGLGAYLLGSAFGTQSELEELCPSVCPANGFDRAQTLINTRDQQQGFGIAGIGVGVASAITGVVLYMMAGPAEVPTSSGAIIITPTSNGLRVEF